MKKSNLLLSAVLIAAMALAGCGSKPAETPPAAGESPTVSQPPASPAPAAESKGTKYAADPERSKASYKVNETFLGNQLNTDAVGSTTEFKGEIVVHEGVVQPSTIQVNLHTLKSDEAKRDNRVRQALETSAHPYATFQITGAEGNPVLKDSQESTIKLVGTMTIKGTEKPVVWEGVAKLTGDTLTLSVRTAFKMTEFGVKPPSIAGFVSVVDETTLMVEYVGNKQ